MLDRLQSAPVNAQEHPITLRSIGDILLRQWRLIVGVAVTLFIATFLVLLTLTPRYTATAQVLVEIRKEGSSIGFDAFGGDINRDTAAIDSQVAIISSTSLLRRVVEKENLTQDDEFGIRVVPPSFLSNFLSFFRGPPEAKSPPSAQDAILASTLALAGAVHVERALRTYVLSVSVTSRSAEKAAKLANAVAAAYIVDQLEARFEAAKQASGWLGERLERLQNELRGSEEAVSRFRSENNLVSAVTGTLSEAQLSDLNSKLAAARAESAEKKAKYDQAERIISEGGSLQTIPDVIKSSVIASLRTQQAEISRREADLVTRYGDRHPSVVNVRAERQDNERQVRGEVNRIVANLKNDYDISKSRQESLERSLGVLSRQPGSSDDAIAVQLRQLERVAAANKTLYESMLSRFKISESQATLQIREGRIISNATIPSAPSFPRRRLILQIALIFSFGAGFGTAFLLENLQRGFTTGTEIEDALSLPALATVPLLIAKELLVDGKQLTPPLYLTMKPLSRFSEAIRGLRAGIHMSDVDNSPKIIQVSSALASEGKSTVAIALAQSAATAMRRVLIIDCDLRRPGVTKYFKLEKRPGLVDLLLGEVAVESVMARDPVSGIFIIPAGTTTHNPPDLLASARMQNVIEHLRNTFDYIVLDSPPVGPVVDPVILSKSAEKIIFVIKWHSTPREVVVRALNQFNAPQKIAGVVLNLVDFSVAGRRGGGYYYASYYDKYYKN